jgi:hypothetical protein
MKSMAGTTRPPPIAVLGAEFDAFLFASIGEDKNGMEVSVLSGLARSDVDPWQEALRLANLSDESATQRLAALISALPDWGASHSDPRAIADSLIGRLPRPSGFNVGSREPSRDVGTLSSLRPWWIYVVFMCFALGSQFLIARHQLSMKPDDIGAGAMSANTVSAPAPAANAGQ